MKHLSPSRFVFALLFVFGLYGSFILLETTRLPERVATHFDGAGHPNGWMSKTSARTSFLLIGPSLSLFVMGIGYFIRYVSSNSLNVPNAEFWRSPENSPRAYEFLFKMISVKALALLAFMASLFHQVIQANQTVPPHFDNKGMMLNTVVFFLFMGGWAFILLRFFRKIPMKS